MRIGSGLSMQFGVLDGTDHLVSPDGYLAAARARAEAGFNHVELSADAYTFNPDVFSPENVAHFKDLQDEFGLTFSLHLHNGYGIDLDSLNEITRRAAVQVTLEVIEALWPLNLHHIVVHTVWAYIAAHHLVDSDLPHATKHDVLSRIAETSARSLADLVRHMDARDLCLENLFIDFQWVWQLVQEFNTSVCFDGGHWHLLGQEAMTFVQRYGDRVAIVHCHDVADGRDHQRLTKPLTIPWDLILVSLHKRGFDGPVVLELSCDADVYASLPVLRELVASTERNHEK